MSFEWQVKELDELCSLITDGSHRSPKSTEFGKPMASVKDMTNFGIDYESSRKISEEEYENLKRSGCCPNKGDVLIAKDGSVLETVCVHNDERDVCLLSSIAIFRTNKDLDPYFLKYFFETPSTKHIAKSGYMTGSVIPRIVLKDFKTFPVKFPKIEKQKEISNFLRNIDEKIALNKKTNETLEDIAKALFKSWFIDFDPVRAKVEGCSNGLPDEISNLFPDSFEDSDIGKIPKGWEVKKLGEIIELAYGKPLKESERIKGAFAVFGSNGKVGTHEDYLVKGPGIIVGRKGNPGIVKWSDDNFFPIDTTFYVKPKSEISEMTFLFFVLLNQKLSNLSADSAVPGLNRNIAYMNQQVIPSPDVISLFEEQVRKLFLRKKISDSESSLLQNLRDSLLPKIISGELRIPDAEKMMEEIS
nr:restriction endonuclease subunit S [Prochlorococcus marinus]